ncbi:hypothetical protein [Virgibacillus siamensis]|uniref:hypothetical protein n=1 Tax=Virgibacillus siamensis TaxID=480071 RepID=UPI000984A946|nr:hypothetical protein [Virgibacillus siamensis]
MKFKHIGLFILVFTFLFLIVLQISTLIPFIANHTDSLSVELIKDQSLTILLHPIETMQILVNANNPLFWALIAAAFLYAIFVSYRLGKSKEGWEVDAKEQSHGSARFATSKELFNNGEFNGCSTKETFKEFLQSLDDGGGKHEN